MVNGSTQSGGIGIIGLLGIVFVVLKLTGYIDWSWWWVTAPFWGGLALCSLIGLIGLVIIGVVALIADVAEKSK